jgi:FixJ family two-component response regulator
MAENKLLDGKRVLAVDDEKDVLDTLVDLLPMCQVVTASSFEVAQKLLETEHFGIKTPAEAGRQKSKAV